MKVVGESVCSSDNWIPLNEGLLEYRGLLHAMPQMINNNMNVMNRLDELRKANISQKVTINVVITCFVYGFGFRLRRIS